MMSKCKSRLIELASLPIALTLALLIITRHGRVYKKTKKTKKTNNTILTLIRIMETYKTYAFQYCDGPTIIEDTDLISKAEAIALWDKHKDDFEEKAIKSIKNEGDHLEMVIWSELNADLLYDKKLKYANSADMTIHGGGLYQMRRFKL